MKKRLLTVSLAVCLVLALSTMTAMADDAVVTDIDGLKSAVQTSGTITIGADLKLSTDDIVTVPQGVTIVLDMQGHSITVDSNFTGRPIVNNGTLTVTGKGTIDSSNSKWGGYGAINNYGTLTIENGTYIGNINADGAAIYNRAGGELTINDGYFTGTAAINSAGRLTINDGSFCTDSCNQYKDGTGKAHWAYCVISSGELYFYNGSVTGVQGALAINNGYAEVYDGDFQTVGCEHGTKGEYSYYALYIAGEEGKVEAHIYGGTYTAAYRVAVLCGNDNTGGDGGINARATANIHGGTFVGGNNAKSAMSAGTNTGDPTITGGTFTYKDTDGVKYYSDVSKYIPDGSTLIQNTDTGEVIVDKSKTAIARVDGVDYTDLAKAIAAADDGDTVTLLEDEEIDKSLELKDGITLDLGGNTLTSTDDYTVVCATGASAEVINGNLTGGTDSTVYNNGTALTLNGVNVTYSGSRCAIQNDTGSLTLVDCTVNGGSGGGIWDFGTKSSVKLTNSNVTGGYFAVYHNGSTAGFTLNAENSTLIGDSEDACAIYVSGSATNTAESAHGMNNIKLTNCTVTGPTGIEGKYTNMVLTNCDITATAEPDFEQNNNGTTALGFAVVSTDNSMDPNSPAPESDITINGGAYDGIVGLGQYEDIDKYEGFQESDYTVTGGSFANPLPSEYLDDSLNAELYSRSNSDTPYSYYSTVEKAMDAAQPGDIVTDLSGVTGDTRYNVTFNYGNNDSETVSVSEGATITFTAPTRSGYEFRGWRDNSGKLHKAGETVTVNSDMVFTAVWSAINIPDTYDIEIADTANGSVDTSLSNASAGSTITITATPDSGYSVASVTVTGPDGRVDVTRVNATTYTFKMPAGDVTVRATFTDSDALPFTDVSAGQWFYDAVAYVYTNGMMEGDSATTFNPDGTMTRAMFWAVLGRIDGATITGTNWADQAREWAMAEGVSDGTDPNGLVTREQMVTMLWRYAGEPESSASLSAYTDAESVSDWAETAMRWAIDEGIITGMTDTTLVPQGTATRAQCAAIFMRFDQM